jgi:hypothetical protein
LKLPVGIIQASLEMVRARIEVAFPSEAAVVAQVIDALNPSANALRVRKSREKSSITRNVSGNAGQQLDSTFPARASLSEISSSPQDSEGLDSEKRESREARPLSRPVAGQQLDGNAGQLDAGRAGRIRNAALAGCWDGVGGVSTGGSMRARIGEAVPLIERLARERGVDPVELFQGACDRFKRDEALKAKRMCTLPVLLSQLEQWVDEAPAIPAASGAPPAIVSPARKLLNPPTKAGAA